MNLNESKQKDFQASNEMMRMQADLMRAQAEFGMKVVVGTQDIVARTQESLKKLPQDFEKGLNEVKNMFWIQFVIGIVMLLGSVWFYSAGYDTLTYIFGASGGVTLVATFITTPPLRLQKNRVDLSQWMMAYFNWFNTSLATNTVLQQMMQDGTLTWEAFRSIQGFLLETTDKTLKIIEEMCEFQYSPSKQADSKQKIKTQSKEEDKG